MYLHFLTAVLSCWPVHSFPHRAVRDYYSVIVIIWHTWAETFFFLFLQHLCPVSLCHIRALSLYSTPPNPLCCSTVWWQGASLLGRWDSNQSGLPRGPSDRRARLPNCPQAGRPAGSAAATHVHRGTGAAVLAGLLSVWITFLDRWRTSLHRPYGQASGCNREMFFLGWLNSTSHSSGVFLVCASRELRLHSSHMAGHLIFRKINTCWSFINPEHTAT